MNTALIVICVIVVGAFFFMAYTLTTYIIGMTRPEFFKPLEGSQNPSNIRRKIFKILENYLKGWSYALVAIVVFNVIAGLVLVIWLIINQFRQLLVSKHGDVCPAMRISTRYRYQYPLPSLLSFHFDMRGNNGLIKS